MEPERYPGDVLDLLWSHDVISHVTVRLPMGVSHGWSVVTMRLSCTVSEI